MKRVLLTSIAILAFLIIGTVFAVYYAKGYRITPENGSTGVSETGLLVATSNPNGAKVFINRELRTATDNTINLAPGNYDITIQKDGYFPWKKTITIKKEEVSRADALLFPTAVKLENITTTGAQNPVTDLSGDLIAYTTSSLSAQENGIYVLDMTSSPIFGIGGAPITQIANDTTNQFSQSSLEFSPDGGQLIASVSSEFSTSSYLLSTRSLNNNPQFVTVTLPIIQSKWNTQKDTDMNKLIDVQSNELSALIRTYFSNMLFSPDRNKILYEASGSATLPPVIQPALAGVDSTPEERSIKPGNIYVYDIKEDRNYLLFDKGEPEEKTNTPKYTWYDSTHLLYEEANKINIMEYDGQNRTTVYTGPFVDHFVYPWPNGSSLVILTTLNSTDTPYNLYRLSLR